MQNTGKSSKKSQGMKYVVFILHWKIQHANQIQAFQSFLWLLKFGGNFPPPPTPKNGGKPNFEKTAVPPTPNIWKMGGGEKKNQILKKKVKIFFARFARGASQCVVLSITVLPLGITQKWVSLRQNWWLLLQIYRWLNVLFQHWKLWRRRRETAWAFERLLIVGSILPENLSEFDLEKMIQTMSQDWRVPILIWQAHCVWLGISESFWNSLALYCILFQFASARSCKCLTTSSIFRHASVHNVRSRAPKARAKKIWHILTSWCRN